MFVNFKTNSLKWGKDGGHSSAQDQNFIKLKQQIEQIITKMLKDHDIQKVEPEVMKNAMGAFTKKLEEAKPEGVTVEQFLNEKKFVVLSQETMEKAFNSVFGRHTGEALEKAHSQTQRGTNR